MPFRTEIETQAKFHCGLMGRWAGIAGRLEGLGVNKFKEHLQKSRQSLLFVVERLRGLQSAGKGSRHEF